MIQQCQREKVQFSGPRGMVDVSSRDGTVLCVVSFIPSPFAVLYFPHFPGEFQYTTFPACFQQVSPKVSFSSQTTIPVAPDFHFCCCFSICTFNLSYKTLKKDTDIYIC